MVRAARRKGEVLYRASFPLESDYNPGVLQEVERGSVSFADHQEVYPRTPHPLQQRHVIKSAVLDVVQVQCPRE